MKTYTYKVVGDLELKVDVYTQPAEGKAKPVIIWIHGGALISGNRKGMAFDDLWDLTSSSGYIVASFDYRLAPETKLGEIFQDLQAGYQWLWDNGSSLFEADVERIAVVGGSAGGYLAQLAGVHFQPCPQAVVSLCGYGDIIADWYAKPDPFYCTHYRAVSKEQAYAPVGEQETTSEDLDKRFDFYLYCRQNGLWPLYVLGVDPRKDREAFQPYRPLKNITPHYPPIFLAHSTEDTDVPYSESLNMSLELARVGTDFEFVTVSGGHCFDTTDKGETDELWKKVVAFLDRQVKDRAIRL